MAERELRTHINAAIMAGIVGLFWLAGILSVIAFPPEEVPEPRLPRCSEARG